MKLIYMIPLDQVKLSRDAMLKGFEGFTLVYSQGFLKVYKAVKP